MSHNSLQYLTPNDWLLITSKANRMAFSMGEEIVSQGTSSDSIYIIRSGAASVELATPHSRVVLAILEAEDVCGERFASHDAQCLGIGYCQGRMLRHMLSKFVNWS